MDQYLNHKDLSLDEIYTILEELQQMGCLQLIFTGGEIFMRRDIFQIIRKAKTLGFHIALFSNVTMITKKIAQKLSEFSPIDIEASLYGMTSKSYENVTQRHHSFDAFIQGIHLLKQYGIRLKMKMPVMTLNYDDFDAARRFAFELGIPLQYNPFLTPRWDGSHKPLELRLSPEKAAQIRVSHIEMMENGKNEAKFWTERACGQTDALFNCSCGKSSAVISPNGTMRLCTDIQEPQFDILKMGVQKAWEKLLGIY